MCGLSFSVWDMGITPGAEGTSVGSGVCPGKARERSEGEKSSPGWEREEWRENEKENMNSERKEAGRRRASWQGLKSQG